MLCIYRIMWHTKILRSQFLILRLLYDRIHEETACIALHLGVRQLGITNLYDDLTKLLGGRRCDAFLFQTAADVTIVEIGHKGARKAIDDMGDKILVAPLMLEFALAITILAISIVEDHQLTCGNLHCFHLIYNILRLDTIGTDVLYGTRPYLTRDNRQVLGTMITILHGKSHDIIEDLAASAFQEDGSRFLITQDLNALDGRMKHGSRVIAREQEVASSSQDEQRLILCCQRRNNLLGFLNRGILQEAMASCLYAKCIVRQEAVVLNIFHRIIFLNII